MAVARGSRSIPRRSRFTAALLLCCALIAAMAVACTPAPYEESRQMLGTTVEMTLYGPDRDALVEAAEDAFAAMAEVEAALDPYDPESDVSAINAEPYVQHPLPVQAREVLVAIDEADVAKWFDPALWGVTTLYDFGGEEAVPHFETLELALQDAHSVHYGESYEDVVFGLLKSDISRTGPGLDFGGAAKGLALDRAAAVLVSDSSVDGALVTVGSSTLALGEKPDGKPWRIGIEDPRETGRAVAAIVAPTGPIWVSTSGDYQQFFERDGKRYHHILDPGTGQPVDDVRSVTVFGTELSGLATDILSTALFVAGPEEAAAYADSHGIGMYLVDAQGWATIALGDRAPGIMLEELERPLP